MNFKDYLKVAALEIDKRLNSLLGNWEKEVNLTILTLAPLIKTFIKANAGGKKLRGVLIKLGYQIAGGGENKAILDVAAAYEIFHTSILAHDDIIDQSPKRRGRSSLYKALGGGHLGLSLAICLADCGFFLATKTISESNFATESKILALEHFSKTVLNTALGEMLDVKLPYLNKNKWGKDVFNIMRLKTAEYTISAPLQIGAILAGGDPKLIRGLGEFGKNLGIAFQIQDDILGVFGSAKKLGKSVTTDIEEGKNTLLVIQAVRQANLTQRKTLQKYYGNGTIGQKGFEALKQVFSQTGALKYAQTKELEYINKAKVVIPAITTDNNLRRLLEEMTEYLVQRSK